MDIALALRTMVIPIARDADAPSSLAISASHTATSCAPWTVHLQAGAGVVLDSNPTAEWQETLHKASALGRAIDLAESAFLRA